jgi:hypothetical protein
MDLYDTKSRAAEAFVESIFRRAQFGVQPFRDPQSALRFGREDFSPSFSIVGRDGEPEPKLIVVKYRPAVEQFLALENKRRESSIFVLVRRFWPQLHFVIVTDHPEPGRSCFQAVASDSAPFVTADLADIAELKIFPHNVHDHEQLLLRLFGLLARG